MNTLQQVIEEMKDDFKKATDKARELSAKEYIHLEALFDGKRSAFLKYIPRLEALLNEQPVAITDDAHFCKHDVQRSAARLA